jgi:hypothetical protein
MILKSEVLRVVDSIIFHFSGCSVLPTGSFAEIPRNSHFLIPGKYRFYLLQINRNISCPLKFYSCSSDITKKTAANRKTDNSISFKVT